MAKVVLLPNTRYTRGGTEVTKEAISKFIERAAKETLIAEHGYPDLSKIYSPDKMIDRLKLLDVSKSAGVLKNVRIDDDGSLVCDFESAEYKEEVVFGIRSMSTRHGKIGEIITFDVLGPKNL